jgi:hypothetical protein
VHSISGVFLLHPQLKYVPYRGGAASVAKSNRMRWAGHAARMEEIRNTYNILVGKSEGV